MELGGHLKMIESSQCSAFKIIDCIDLAKMVGYHITDDNGGHQVASSQVYPTIGFMSII